MAARNLRAAAATAVRHPAKARELGVDSEEEAAWRDAAAAVYVPYDEELGVHPQSEGFTGYAEWDFEAYKDKYPLMLHAPYFELYRKQVVKQADLMLATYWCGDAFTPEEKARNFDYYERLTVRDSSLSACVQAVMAAEVGHLDLAYDYAYEAALIDMRNLHHNTGDGLHMASLAGAWTALVAGFGGLRERDGCLCFDPALPQGMSAAGLLDPLAWCPAEGGDHRGRGHLHGARRRGLQRLLQTRRRADHRHPGPPGDPAAGQADPAAAPPDPAARPRAPLRPGPERPAGG